MGVEVRECRQGGKTTQVIERGAGQCSHCAKVVSVDGKGQGSAHSSALSGSVMASSDMFCIPVGSLFVRSHGLGPKKT